VAWGNGSPRGWPEQFTPSLMNSIEPYREIWFPAMQFDSGAIKPTTKQQIQINAQEQQYTVHTFPGNQNTECFMVWAFRGIPIDISDPQFKLCCQFFQKVGATSSQAVFEASIGVSYDGTSIDYTLEGAAEVPKINKINNAYLSLCWDFPTPNEAVSLPNQAGAGALLSNRFNFIQIQIERFGTSADDYFGDDIHMLQCGIQYKTDFANISQWPSS